MADDDAPEEAPRAILYGEIVPLDEVEPPPAGSNRRFRVDIDEDEIREIILERMAGWPLRAIGEKHGVSHQTVKRWTDDAIGERIYSPDMVPRVRARLALELEAAREQAWLIARAHPDSKAALEALAQIRPLIMDEAKLLGVIAPVRIDATITAVTEAERELQEMINEAAAKEANREERIVADVTADEDL